MNQEIRGVLERLSELLPDSIIIKTCYTCLYSDYSVYGSDIFGCMLCFRSVKDQYIQVKDKCEYMNIMDNFDRFVQETYLCEDFAPVSKEQATGANKSKSSPVDRRGFRL